MRGIGSIQIALREIREDVEEHRAMVFTPSWGVRIETAEAGCFSGDDPSDFDNMISIHLITPEEDLQIRGGHAN